MHKKNCYIRVQNPKSQIQNLKSNIQNSKSLKSGLTSLDFGFRNFLDFAFRILDYGFRILGVPGDVPLGNSVTMPGGQRLESPLVCLLRETKTNCIWYGWWKKETGQQKRENEGAKTTWVSNVFFFWVACPLPGKLARVGGHRRQPVLIRRCDKTSLPEHVEPHGMRRCLSFSYMGTLPLPPTPPGGQKRFFFEEWSMCIKHRKYRQKRPLGGAGLGLTGGMPKTVPPAGSMIFCVFSFFKSQDF